MGDMMYLILHADGYIYIIHELFMYHIITVTLLYQAGICINMSLVIPYNKLHCPCITQRSFVLDYEVTFTLPLSSGKV